MHAYQGLHIQLYTPDDGCKKRPKHVEWSRSEIKITTQPHRVGLFNSDLFQSSEVKTSLPVDALCALNDQCYSV